MQIRDFIKRSEYEWEIDRKFNPSMKVPIRVFSSEEMIKDALQDRSIEQAIHASFLPGVVGSICVMPDVHQGYGFPIGGVAAMDFNDGVISPGAIGYDINCGVRLLSSSIPFIDAQPFIHDFTIALNKACPSGVGEDGPIKLGANELKNVCRDGSGWALKQGFATQNDIDSTEDGGSISGANPDVVSRRAFERGFSQVGSLGAGNHFIEVDIVEEVFDRASAGVMGLYEGNLALQLHSGSRGFGHQICTDFVQDFQTVVRKYHIELPDRELVCAPIQSMEGQKYLAAMRCAANYAFCNRQMLTFYTREVFEKFFPKHHLHTVYDLAHNIGKIEKHRVGEREIKVCVHRKGATRAFGPEHPDLSEKYRHVGQPVLVPGSMGTASWVLVGTREAMQKSFGSCSHGAGRVLSRSQAKRMMRGDQILSQLKSKGIFVQAGSMPGLAEEAPQAYKDVNSVINCVEGAGLGKKVARLVPVAVIKG